MSRAIMTVVAAVSLQADHTSGAESLRSRYSMKRHRPHQDHGHELGANTHTNSSDVRPNLPARIFQVLGRPAQVFSDLSNQMGTFESRLQDVQREKLAAIAAQKLNYEQRLDEQRRSNAQMGSANLRISSEISKINRFVKRKRSRIDELGNENKNLRNDFIILLANLTTAKEFTVTALRKENTGGELQVLAALKRQEKVRNAVEAKKKFWRQLHIQDQDEYIVADSEERAEEMSEEEGGGEDEDEEHSEDDGEIPALLSDDEDEKSAEAIGDNLAAGGSDWEMLSRRAGGELDVVGTNAGPMDYDDEWNRGDDRVSKDGDDDEMDRPKIDWEHGHTDNFREEVDYSVQLGPGAPSLLQLFTEQAEEVAELPDPMMLLKDLHDNLDNLGQVHDHSVRKLDEIFKSQYDKGLERTRTLTLEQEALNATRINLRTLKPRLSDAESHMVSMRRYLIRQLHALRAFLTAVGNTPPPVAKGALNAGRAQAGKSQQSAILLQVKGGPVSTTTAAPEVETTRLPLLSDVLTDSYDTFRNVDNKVGQLEEHLLDMEEQAKVSLLDTQLGNEDKLMDQNRDCLRMAKANTNIASDIHAYKQMNQQLQSRARQIQKENVLIRRDLEKVNANISVAVAFAKNTLVHSMDNDAPELTVMRELQRKDAKEAAEQAAKQRFDEIADPWKGVFADEAGVFPMLLQVKEEHNGPQDAGPTRSSVSARRRERETLRKEFMAKAVEDSQALELHNSAKREADASTLSPGALLLEMETNLKKLGAAHAASKETLNHIFAQAYTQGQDRLSSLVREQTMLNASLRTSAALAPKLKAALEKVEATQRNLTDQDLSVKKFLTRLGRSGEAQTIVEAEDLTDSLGPHVLLTKGQHPAPSLLQMSSRVVRRTHSSTTASSTRPESHSSAFNAMSSKATALQAKLTEMEGESQQRLEAKTKEYARRLMLVGGKTRKLSAQAEELKADNKEIDDKNALLRRKAKALQEDRVSLSKDLEDISRILSTASEFTSKTIVDGSAASSELQVLDELDEKDRVQGLQEDKKSRLSEIASAAHGPLVGLLQTSRDNPKALLAVLEGGFDDLAKEYEGKEKVAQANFEKEMKVKYEEYKTAEALVTRLQETRQKGLNLQARLEKAVKHLEGKCSNLQARAKSLRSFADRLSKRPDVKTSHGPDSGDVPAPQVVSESVPESVSKGHASFLVQNEVEHKTTWLGRFLR